LRRALLDINVLIALPALAVKRGGRFVTFDRADPLSAVLRAEEEHLEVI